MILAKCRPFILKRDGALSVARSNHRLDADDRALLQHFSEARTGVVSVVRNIRLHVHFLADMMTAVFFNDSIAARRHEALDRFSYQADLRAGAKIGLIGEAIERFVSPRGYTVIKEYGGHHIGKEMHMKPDIPHYTDYTSPGFREVLKEGAVICIEPMITPGNGQSAISLEDKWTAFCKDHQPVVMYEEMILVLKDSYEILTNHLDNRGKIIN